MLDNGSVRAVEAEVKIERRPDGLPWFIHVAFRGIATAADRVGLRTAEFN